MDFTELRKLQLDPAVGKLSPSRKWLTVFIAQAKLMNRKTENKNSVTYDKRIIGLHSYQSQQLFLVCLRGQREKGDDDAKPDSASYT